MQAKRTRLYFNAALGMVFDYFSLGFRRLSALGFQAYFSMNVGAFGPHFGVLWRPEAEKSEFFWTSVVWLFF